MADFTVTLGMLEHTKNTNDVFSGYKKAYRYARMAMEKHIANQDALQATLTTEQLALVEQGRIWAESQLALAEANFWHFLDLPDPTLTTIPEEIIKKENDNG